MADIKEQLKLLPENPGIYKFLDRNNQIIYVGKAKNLKKRVSSYFSSKTGQSGRIRHLVRQIDRIDFTIVESESEALLLENSLIKKIQPKYNVRLKDGKTYPFLAIRNEPFPRLFTTRILADDGSEYYGPFVSGLNKNYLLDLLKKNFFIRTCNYHLSKENIESRKFKVCLSYHINLCKGPCEGHQSMDEYMQNIEQVRKILKGKTAAVIDFLREKMKTAAKNLEFEKAEEYKNILNAIENYQAKSTVVNPKIRNADVYSVYSNEKLAIVNFLGISNGAVIHTDTLEYHKKLEEKDEDILSLAIQEFRERHLRNSKLIIVPLKPSYKDEKLKYEVPKTGDKKHLLELSHKNAVYYYRELENKKLIQQNKSQRTMSLLLQVQRDMQLKNVPRLIECFDNSNIQGAYPVAAMSVFKEGKPFKQGYRHFNIKTVEGPDDFASMEEVIARRYRRVLEEQLPLPDLIVIDGGKGQLNSAVKVLKELNLFEKVDIIGIAKKLEEIYKPGDSLPLGISKKSATNQLIQRIRNEAHRFGITHHRTRRIKGSLTTELDNIKGIGKESIRQLLTRFRSVVNIEKADFEEIAEIIGKHRAKIIREYFDAERNL
ncbi:MAG: excinuclease ABC subunit C [Sphingobacteriales bacterium]|nr:excinuclease ABC subunit C [Sphingobacteriales bacterium]